LKELLQILLGIARTGCAEFLYRYLLSAQSRDVHHECGSKASAAAACNRRSALTGT
jgi:hypothetical protein